MLIRVKTDQRVLRQLENLKQKDRQNFKLFYSLLNGYQVKEESARKDFSIENWKFSSGATTG
jgi:hypothetical protein